MNERIQELIKQAMIIEDDELFAREVFDREKFAELLIRECAELCDINDREQGDILREHFGVE